MQIGYLLNDHDANLVRLGYLLNNQVWPIGYL